ncbi:MAG: aldo/keto reductase, partial [Halobacteriales archaeon]
PFANQIEIHPLLQQRELRAVCADLDIELVAYSPLARGQVLENEVLSDIAEAHDASSPQVALAWLREHGLTAIPKATSRAHIADNWASLDLQLTESEVQRIDELDRQDRQVDPSWAPWRD